MKPSWTTHTSTGSTVSKRATAGRRDSRGEVGGGEGKTGVVPRIAGIAARVHHQNGAPCGWGPL